MEIEKDEIFNEENCEFIVLHPEDEKEDINFWYFEKDKIKIDNLFFLDLLNKTGFRKYSVDQDYFFVYVNNKIVEEVNISTIKDFIKVLMKNPSRNYEEGVDGLMILRKITEVAPSVLTKGNLEFLDKLEDDFKYDTSKKSFIYFENCFVEVTADGYEIHDYIDLDKHIWRAQIINREFNPEKEESDFKKFIMMVCRFDENRYNSLRSAIGYLLHTYKDPVIAKAIIFMDEKLDDNPNGGSGKSLLGSAIAEVRQSLRLGGKNFRFDRFSFQSYEPGTSIIEINDISRNFPFEMLFTIITDNIVIEKKNKDEIIIPFKYAPKILLSTNYTIKGLDESSLRRQFIIEFSDYFNMRYTPADEFGSRFFENWSQFEWDKFYMFMIECLQYYLKNGLVDYERVNLDKKKLIVSTSEEFVEFVEDIETNKWYGKKEMYRKFLENYPEYTNRQFRQYTFTTWFKTYAKLNKLIYEIKKINDDRYFRIISEDTPPDQSEIQSDQGNLF